MQEVRAGEGSAVAHCLSGTNQEKGLSSWFFAFLNGSDSLCFSSVAEGSILRLC